MASILVIDDDEQLRTMLKLVLQLAGYDVIDAGNGDEGLQRYSAQPADLVITDIIMPGKEGLETILELRRRDPLVKIIAISGGGQAGDNQYLRLAKKFGASQVLAKPFSNEEILLAVGELLSDGRDR